MSIKFLFWEGGYFGFFLGGSADSIFMGAGIFLINNGAQRTHARTGAQSTSVHGQALSGKNIWKEPANKDFDVKAQKISCQNTIGDELRGPESWKISISLERLKISSFRLKFSISLENFNLAWNIQSWPWEFPTKIEVLVGGSLEMFNPAWKCHFFQSRLKISISCPNPEFFKIRALWEIITYYILKR